MPRAKAMTRVYTDFHDGKDKSLCACGLEATRLFHTDKGATPICDEQYSKLKKQSDAIDEHITGLDPTEKPQSLAKFLCISNYYMKPK